jgi:hypothetical protein
MSRSADLDEQSLKIGIAMLVSFALQMQMIMAKFMFDNGFRLFCAMDGQLMRTDLDIMALRKISASGRSEP